MKRRTVWLRYFRCPVCDAEMTASKHTPTENGHIKTMWCGVCRAERDFIQIDKERMRRK